MSPFDVPTPAATLARAREMLSPRAQAGLAALPAERQATNDGSVVAGLPIDARLWAAAKA
ncbi:MAG: hypothetical protein BWZ09_02095 [Alphaproteobacteria bacterium ADurb.BinA305]|nr:MAG: hypothetical protein BWZ09_02095 [Alphaproteobacteria bacterium ADurb.BinA305]